MLSKFFIVAFSAFSFCVTGSPTGAAFDKGRRTSQDYYLKTRTANSSSLLNNLYRTHFIPLQVEDKTAPSKPMLLTSSHLVSLGDDNGFAAWAAHTAIIVAFLPQVGNKTARGYMNGTYQAFDVGSVGIPGATYALGSSEFQEPDPSVPGSADIFQDGTGWHSPLEVSVKDNTILWAGDRKWLGKSLVVRVSTARPKLLLVFLTL